MAKRLPRLWLALLLITLSLVIGCASSFEPRTPQEINFQERSQTRVEGNLQVTAAVLSADVDGTRAFLIQDLWYSQGLKSFGYVKGVGAAPYSEPRGNLTGDPYFTDGLRAVFWVTSKPAAFSDVGWIDWEEPLER